MICGRKKQFIPQKTTSFRAQSFSIRRTRINKTRLPSCLCPKPHYTDDNTHTVIKVIENTRICPLYRSTQRVTCTFAPTQCDGRPQSEVQVGPDKLEVVASFCYLGDMLSAGGGCEMAVTTRVKTAWKNFRELLPVLTSRHLSDKTRGHVYSSCVRSAMLHASETWPLTKTNLQRLQRNDRAMIRQICSIKPEDVARVRSSELLAKLQLEDLDLIFVLFDLILYVPSTIFQL